MSPDKLSVKVFYALFAICGLIVWRLFSITYMLGFDFQIYHQAAEAALSGISPYYPYIVGSSYLYHPAFLLMVAPFTLLDPLVASLLWMVASIALYYATWRMLAARLTLPARYKFFLFAMLAVSSGAAESFWMGQVNALIVFLITFCVLYAAERPVLAGAALAVAIVAKTSPVIFVLYLLASRRWSAALWTAIVLAALTAASGFLLGWPLLADFVSVNTQLTGAPAAEHVNLALALRLANFGVPVGLAIWIQRGIAGVLILSSLIFAYRRQAPLLSFSAMLTGMVLASPLLWGHHTVLAMSALVFLANVRWTWALIAMSLMQAELFMSYFFDFPGALLINLGMLALTAGLLYLMWKEAGQLRTSPPAPLHAGEG
jgi:alpha-1,2-mannosyltransferase